MSKDADSPTLSRFRDLPDFPAFEAFAHALWRDEAAAMVGAGFSRACIREKNSPTPPLWSDFKEEMASALGYGQSNGPDALRLAQEYKTLHGDSGLDQLIRRKVADDEWEPGLLHQQFLELPWRDILTTNWDTLLERTRPKTPDRIYSCVRTIQDIAHRPHPRIVKLHGSLPSHKPFIFSEDDYRTYPVRFAPFVNLAQQVMLEHDLCLIGFSGIDPNFLAWSGWVRDTLSISARRIRLVGVLNLSPVSRALLEERNVTPIDLAPLVSNVHKDEQHEKALEYFFSALLAAKPPSPYTWQIGSDKFPLSSDAKEGGDTSCEDVAFSWREEKKRYPGWIVCPYKEATQLRRHSRTEQQSNGSAETNFRFAQERIWRHRTAAIWLNPDDMKNADIHFEVAAQSLSKAEQTELCASVASEWRRYQKWEEWARWVARLEAIGSDEAVLQQAYESAQRALINWEDEEALKAVSKLNSDEPVWMMRRAGLLAALFRYREAAELYQASLLRIRQKLLTAPKSAWLISLEGWASLFHQASYSELKDDYTPYPRDESDETRMRLVAAKADPWDTITRLERLASDRMERNRKEAEQWKLSFKSGRYSPVNTTRLVRDNECPFYGLLELMERTGAPGNISNMNLFSSRMEAAYRAITGCDEDDLLTFLAQYRGSDTKILDWVMPRMQVARLSVPAVEHLISVIPRRIDRLTKLQTLRGVDDQAVFLFELLARVIVRAPSKQALELLEWIIELLHSSHFSWRYYLPCRAALEGALEAMEPDERQYAMDLALHMKTPGEAGVRGIERDWPELFENFSEEDARKLIISAHSVFRIDTLIDLVENGAELDRSRALIRLHVLYKADKLSSEQSSLLESAVWSRRDQSGWPCDTQLYTWVFQELPGKGRADELFIEKVIGSVVNGQIEHELLMNLRIGLGKIEAGVPKSSIVSCVKSCLAWTPTARAEENSFVLAFSDNEVQDRAAAREIGELLAQSLLPRLEVEDLPTDVVKQLMHPEALPHIPSLAASAFQMARLWQSQRSKAFAQIRSAIASRDPMRVFPAHTAMSQFIQNVSTQSDVPPEIKELLLHACEQRTQPGLGSTLKLLGDLHEKGQLNTDDSDRLAMALPVLLNEYNYAQERLEVPSMAELPGVRREVHRLSSFLVGHYTELEKLKLELESDALPEVRFID